jgi:non-specific serine/threonine protein kinase
MDTAMASQLIAPASRDHRQPWGVESRSVPEDLPSYLTRLFGRQEDIATVTALLQRDDVRLVTLTGSGGVGKPRLAIEIARSLAREGNIVWFVPLASISDVSHVPGAIARITQVPVDEVGEAEDRRTLARTTDPSGFLVLDNLEQLPDAGPVVETMLKDAPGLTVLVTSRSRLDVAGEQTYTVSPLAVAVADGSVDLDLMGGADAVRLFEDRARAANSSFELTRRNTLDVAAICRQLDGLPLAIEIVAAHAYAFPPSVLRDRLQGSLSLSSPASSGEPARFHSMEQSITWSFELLEPREQDTLVQLGVFAGPWTLAAAEAVVLGDRLALSGEVVDSIDELVKHNLVRPPAADGTPTYVLLETIRTFASERLHARADVGEVERRLTRWIVSQAEACTTSVYRADGNRTLADLDVHIADVMQVLARLDAQGESDALLAVASNLSFLWGCQGRGREGRPWLERAEAIGRIDKSVRLGPVLIALGALLHIQGHERQARDKATEGLALTSSEVEPNFWRHGMVLLGFVALRQNRLQDSMMFQEQALAAVPDLPDLAWARCVESTVLGHLGNIAVAQGEIDTAERYFHEALEVQVRLGFARGTSHFMASHPIAGLGDVARAHGRVGDALALYQEALGPARAFDDYRASVYAMGGVAASLAAGGAWQAAATLFGACEALHRARQVHWELETMDRQRALGLPEPWYGAGTSFGHGQPLHDRLAAGRPNRVPPIPDPEHAARLWREGALLSMDQATVMALDARLPPIKPGRASDILSERELDVLRLVATGKTDAEIATALFISPRTVSNHVRSILGKVDVTSRAAATAYAVRNHLA